MTASPPSSPRTLGHKVFDTRDQLAFAAASQDWNPMHMDPVAARRVLSGRQVVHGIHTLLQALDLCEAPHTTTLKVGCSFANPVNVDDAVVFTQTDEGAGRTRVLASVAGLVCTDIVLESGSTPGPALQPAAGQVHRRIGALPAPLDEAAGSQTGVLFEIEDSANTLAERFPQAARLVGTAGLSALARLSFFVGMVCPGLHSVFSSLQFTVGPASSGPSRLEVRRYDPRFGLFVVAFDGAVQGELRAFLRPAPQRQPSAADVAAGFNGREFAGTRALVLGGSRGLGEVTSKIIAAGGGDVVVTYANGRADAQAVADDINALGRGRCEIAAADLGQTFQGVAGLAPASLHSVYYFATPRIYTKRGEVFDRAAFDQFSGFYLQRFHELCLWLDTVQRPQPLKLYLPSTVFIEERPKGMTEYTMAKAAAEVLADDLNRSLRNVTIVHTRLPRLATDQTSAILKLATASNLDVMTEVVRQIAG